MMFTDQASTLRQLVSDASRRRAQTVAITSGKGGVGKTCVAVNLAVRLAQMGRRVVLLDADLGTANADVLCNVFSGQTLEHVVQGRKRLSQIMIDAPGGFRLVPGASGLARIAALEDGARNRLIAQLDEIEQDADLILIDTSAGISPNVLGFAVNCDQVLVVTTPEPTAMTDAYAMIKTIHRQRHNCRVGVMVNMVHDEPEARSVHGRINSVCRRFLDIPASYAGHLPIDERVVQGVRQRRPFVLQWPNCSASQCIGRLAMRLDRGAADGGDRSLLQRMTGWLARTGA